MRTRSRKRPPSRFTVGVSRMRPARSHRAISTPLAASTVTPPMAPPPPLRIRILVYSLSTFNGSSRSEEHTSELQSLKHLVCRLLLEKQRQHARPCPSRCAAPLPSAPHTPHLHS